MNVEQPIHIGSVPYLNGKPLVWGIENEPSVRISYDVPSKLAPMVSSGEMAVGLVSVAACFADPSLEIIPGIGIGCAGPVESVKLFCRDDVRSIRRVALDTSSLTSCLLTRIVLLEKHGLRFECTPMSPSLDEMLQGNDAAVVIGDPAMKVPAGQYRELDFGEEWYEMTGLPFVFAGWVVNPDRASSEVVDVLTRTKAHGLASLEEISRSESERLDLPYETCYRYLTDIMQYDLTDDHLRGLRLFHRKACEHGLAAPGHVIRLFSGGRS